ncbi:MAG TPA: hypothetical protein VIC26_00630 [Marinagarivorans sp.]
MGKFSALFIGTMGLYQFYWFYKHWQLLGKAQQRSTQPILRSIFHVFFIPFLCTELAKAEREKGQQYRWNPQAVSLGFIVLQIISVLISYYVYQDALAVEWLAMQFPLLFGHFYYLYKFQLVANRVSDDPFGKANTKLTAANHAWIIFGIIHWLDQVRTLYLLVSGQISL